MNPAADLVGEEVDHSDGRLAAAELRLLSLRRSPPTLWLPAGAAAHVEFAAAIGRQLHPRRGRERVGALDALLAASMVGAAKVASVAGAARLATAEAAFDSGCQRWNACPSDFGTHW